MRYKNWSTKIEPLWVDHKDRRLGVRPDGALLPAADHISDSLPCRRSVGQQDAHSTQ